MNHGASATKAGIVYIRPRELIFVRATGPYETSARRAWEGMFALIDSNRWSSGDTCGYGLTLDDPRITAPEKCRYDACIALSTLEGRTIPAHVQTRWLPGGAYARRRHNGSYKLMGQHIHTLRDEWIPNNGLSVDPTRPFLEIYLDDVRVVKESELRAECCLPVVARNDT